MIPGMGNRLKDLRESRGWTHQQAADAVGVSRSQYVKLERGERQLTERYIVMASEGFGVPPAEVIADAAPSLVGPAVLRSGKSLPFAGFIQAGTFLPVDEYFQQDEYPVPEFVLPVQAYSKLRQYAWQARGDSLNLAGILEGMWVVGADAADFVDNYGDIESGDLVVVERTRYQGAERELTVKEIRYYRDRYELHPRSSNPEHKPIVVPHNRAADDGIEVRIIAVVLTAYTDLRPRRR